MAGRAIFNMAGRANSGRRAWSAGSGSDRPPWPPPSTPGDSASRAAATSARRCAPSAAGWTTEAWATTGGRGQDVQEGTLSSAVAALVKVVQERWPGVPSGAVRGDDDGGAEELEDTPELSLPTSSPRC
ncbi:unnamed protein product [Urochloa humidicola]